MGSLLVNAGSLIWRVTPSRTVRELYLRAFLRLVRNRRKIASVEGMTFDLDLGEMIDACLLLQRFERDVAEVIDKLCEPGSVVLDIGANIGAHALRFARAVGPEGQVLAFEPTDFAFRKLEKNISLNSFSSISSFHLALSDENRKAQEIRFRSSWRTDGKSVERRTTVDFARLDDWLEQHQIDRVDIVKIDVDGNEFPVFNGARRMLEQFRPLVIMEVGAWHFQDPERNPVAVLEDLGYSFWDAKRKSRYSNLEEIRAELPAQDTEMGFSINVIAATRAPKGMR